MEYFDKWCANLKEKTSRAWEISITSKGECRRHTGPSIWYASAMIEISPSETFVVEDSLEQNVLQIVKDRGWYDYIIFGVFDVMLTHPTTPIKNFKLRILEVDFNDIESNQMAFRLAARKATLQAIEIHFPNPSK